MRKGKGWYAAFAFIFIAAFVAIYALTGQDAIGAAARFLSNGIVLIRNIIARSAGSFLKLLAQGVGLRRLSRFLAAGASIGLGYAASVVVSDKTVRQAQGWREKAHSALTFAKRTWHEAPLVAKIAAVVCLIVSQVYLHFFLVVFPIAFLVPTVRRIWVRAADMMFGSWYWRAFGPTHRAIVATIKSLPFMRALFDAARLMRLRYLSAWRLWRYDPRYRDPEKQARFVSLIEPLRLLWRGELDRYVGRPLLAGGERQRLLETEVSA